MNRTVEAWIDRILKHNELSNGNGVKKYTFVPFKHLLGETLYYEHNPLVIEQLKRHKRRKR